MKLGFVLILILALAIVCVVLGYLIGFKYKYKLIGGYQYKGDNERYPIEIEKKYCRHIGGPLMIMGVVLEIFPFTLQYSWSATALLTCIGVFMLYIFIVPNYIVRNEFKKLNGN